MTSLKLRSTEETRRAEERLGTPFRSKLREALNEKGVAEVANSLEVNRATIGNWMARLHIEQRYVEIGPDGRYLGEN